MDENIVLTLESIIDDLKTLLSKDNDQAYELILKQMEFIYDCLANNKNIFDELNGRELNFPAVASKNLSGPEESLLNKIGIVTNYLSKL